jgi:hypothetical protein
MPDVKASAATNARRPPTRTISEAFLAELQLARKGRVPNGAGHVSADEPEPPELVVWHKVLDQRKELSLLKPDVCIKQFPGRSQRLSIDAAGRHGDAEFASEPLELHVLDACLAEGSRVRPDESEEKREELFFLFPKMDTLFVPEELHELPGHRQPSRSIFVRGSTAQPHCLHESIVMFARERNQGGVTLHSTTLIRTRRTATRLSPPRSPSRRAMARSWLATTRPTCSRNGVPDPDGPIARPFRLKRPCAMGTANGDRRYGGVNADLRGEPVHRGEWELIPAAPARSWTTACC